jgi:hypothetical protein
MLNSSILKSPETRTLSIDLNAYTGGDHDFKRELIDLIIGNLEELKVTSTLALQKNDAHLFQLITHKMSTTLRMLDDQDLLGTVEQLKIMITDPSRITLLVNLCTGIIEGLRLQ